MICAFQPISPRLESKRHKQGWTAFCLLRLMLTLNLTLASFPLLAQSDPATAPAPEFETVSATLSYPAEKEPSIPHFPSDRFIATKTPLIGLIELAYGVENGQVSRGPGWTNSDTYDISAKVKGDRVLTLDEMRPLLQHLLEQRFHLVLHHETKTLSGYALVVAKGGPRLQPATPVRPQERLLMHLPKGDPQDPILLRLPNGVLARNAHVSSLASLLSDVAGRPVVDQTGIQGNYDFKLSYSIASSINTGLPDIFTAVQEQLGLKLVSEKVSLDRIVIDHVERVPTEN